MTTTLSRDELIKAIENYFEEHEELFNECIEELDSYNGYGNLVSSDYKDYSAHLDRYAIESMKENRNYIDAVDRDSELSELLDALEECEG